MKSKKSLSYEEWAKLSPDDAAEYLVSRSSLDKERQKKVKLILKKFWLKTN